MITKELVYQWARESGYPESLVDIDPRAIPFSQRAAAYGAAQREAELMPVTMSAKHLGWTPHNLEPIYGYTAEQLAAARLQGAEEERKKWAETDDQTIRDRDAYHEMADDLAAQIAAITGGEIGEHSSINSPWQNATLAADDFIAGQLRDLLKPQGERANQGLLNALKGVRFMYEKSGGKCWREVDAAIAAAQAAVADEKLPTKQVSKGLDKALDRITQLEAVVAQARKTLLEQPVMRRSTGTLKPETEMRNQAVAAIDSLGVSKT